jgi:hypothetical protein
LSPVAKQERSGYRRSSAQQQAQSAALATLEAVGLLGGELALALGRHFSLRDLVKWCRRMQVRHELWFCSGRSWLLCGRHGVSINIQQCTRWFPCPRCSVWKHLSKGF